MGKNWEAAKADLQNTDSGILLQGSIDNQVNRLTNRLLDIQKKVCPHRSAVEKLHDPPWFGHQRRNAAKGKMNPGENLIMDHQTATKVFTNKLTGDLKNHPVGKSF